MGVEWHLGCRGCSEYVWLGSLKPFSWHGFQIRNRFVAELLALHSGPTCVLALDVNHTFPHAGWREDLRSLTFWDDEDVCASCRATPAPIVAGWLLAFCSERCRDVFAAMPDRVFRPSPVVPEGTQITVACERCAEQRTVACDLAAPYDQPEDGPFEELADCLGLHIGCPLTARLS